MIDGRLPAHLERSDKVGARWMPTEPGQCSGHILRLVSKDTAVDTFAGFRAIDENFASSNVVAKWLVRCETCGHSFTFTDPWCDE